MKCVKYIPMTGILENDKRHKTSEDSAFELFAFDGEVADIIRINAESTSEVLYIPEQFNVIILHIHYLWKYLFQGLSHNDTKIDSIKTHLNKVCKVLINDTLKQ